MNENTNQIINWCSKGYNPDSTHRETQQEFVNSLQEAVSKMLCMKADVLKKTLESKGLDAETIKQLEDIGAFDSKNLALAEGYTVIGSDFHGDVVSIYGFLVLCGYLIPDKDRTLLMNFKTGEILIDSYSNDKTKQKSVEDILKEHAEENKSGELVLLPGFRINPDFHGKIKLLGDYLDRGCENAMCLALLDFLTQQENYNEHLDVHYGNHETFACSDKYKIKEFRAAIDRILKNKQMTLCSLEELGDGKYISYAHCSLSEEHVPKMLVILKCLAGLEDKIKQEYSNVKKNLTELENFNASLEKYPLNPENGFELTKDQNNSMIQNILSLEELKEDYKSLENKLTCLKSKFETLKNKYAGNNGQNNTKSSESKQPNSKKSKKNKKNKVDNISTKIKNFAAKMGRNMGLFAIKIFETQLEEYKKFMTKDEEYKKYGDLVDKIQKIEFDKCCDLEPKETIEYLGNLGFEAKDYFNLRTIFGRIFGDFGNGFNDGKNKNYIAMEVEDYYNCAVCAIVKEENVSKGEIEHSKGKQSVPWIFFERKNPNDDDHLVHTTKIDKHKPNVIIYQIKGHDANYKTRMPYVSSDSVFCVDSYMSSGYRGKKDDNTNPSDSGIILLIKTPYDSVDMKNNFLIEEYSVARDKDNFKILLEKEGLKSRTHDHTFMAKGKFSDEKVKKKDGQSDKKFNSAKKFVAAYMSHNILKKLGLDEGKKLLEDIFKQLNKDKNKKQDESDKKFSTLLAPEIEILNIQEKHKLTKCSSSEEKLENKIKAFSSHISVHPKYNTCSSGGFIQDRNFTHDVPSSDKKSINEIEYGF